MTSDNPAANLYALLKQSKSIPTHFSSLQAWHAVLQTNDDVSLLLSRMGGVMKLTAKAVKALEHLHGDEHEEQWAYWSQRVNNAFLNQQLVGQWASFIDQIDVHAMGYLKLASAVLRQANPSDLIDGEKIMMVRAQAETLMQKISESDLEESLKNYVLEALQRLLSSIDEIFISGSGPVVSEVESIMGHIVIDENYKNFLTLNSLGKEMVNVLAETANAVVPKGHPQLAGAIQRLAISM